jgi:hypothetical protein
LLTNQQLFSTPNAIMLCLGTKKLLRCPAVFSLP